MKKCASCLKHTLEDMVASNCVEVTVNLKIPVSLYGSLVGEGILLIERPQDWDDFLDPEDFREKLLTKKIIKHFEKEENSFRDISKKLSEEYGVSEDEITDMISEIEEERDERLTRSIQSK